MSKEWREELLVECLDTIIDYRGKTPEKSEDGIKTLSAKSVKMGKILYDEAFTISAETYKNFMTRGFPKIGDVLLTTEAPLGFVARLDRDDIALAQRLITLRGKLNILDNRYLLYYLMSKRGQYELQSRATGTTVQGIKRTEFAKVKIKLPPLPEQKAIAHILGSLDDKIALNRQTNATLEAMVQALFRSWFVDFDPVLDNAWRAGNAIPEALQAKAATRQQILAQADAPRLPQAVLDLFPSSFVFNEALNQWVPEGWEVKPLGVVTKQVFSGGTPNTQEKSYWNGMFNWFSSGETRNNYIIKTEKSITKLGVDNSSTKLALSGDILIASAGQGHTRGQTSYCAISTYVNQSVVVIRPQKNNSIWLYQNLKGRYDEMRMISDSHSIRGSLTSKLIKNLNLIMPKPKLIHYFENRCLANTEKIIENSKQTQTLTQLRDTLLPQLISGRVRVPEGLG